MSLLPLVSPDVLALGFDLPGLRIGIVEYSEGPAGITVFFYFSQPVDAAVAVDVQGGSPGTAFTDLLRIACGKLSVQSHFGSYFRQDFKERPGQCAAFAEFGATKVAIFMIVNARGLVVNRAGTPVLCNRTRESGRRSSVLDDLRGGKRPMLTELAAAAGLSENTTLAVLVTNRELRQDELQRLAFSTHSSMARAIQPFRSERDGDTLFAVTTAEISTSDANRSDLCVLPSDLRDAVLSCAPAPIRTLDEPKDGRV